MRMVLAEACDPPTVKERRGGWQAKTRARHCGDRRRQASLAEPQGLQVELERHVAEQVHDAPVAPILDAPVPQMVDQIADVLKFCDISVPEQVIDVPKISQDSIPRRTVLRDAQLVEQLVQVPTVVSPSFFLLLAEENVDIPVPGARGFLDHGGLPGFLPEESPTAQHSFEQNIDTPVRGARGGGGLQGFFPRTGPPAFGGAEHQGQQSSPRTGSFSVEWSRTFRSSRLSPRTVFNSVSC